MAKDKLKELEYKIEGLKRMMKRKIKRQQKYRRKSLEKQRWSDVGDSFWRDY